MAVKWSGLIRKYKNIIFLFLLVLLTLRVIIPQLGALGDSLAALDTANLYWILVGVIIFFLNVPISTLQFMVLALKPIAFYLTFRVEMAVLFVSKLLPSSLGSISLNVFYLIKSKHTASQAAAVMTMDGITSGIAYAILIIAALLTSSLNLDGLNGSINISSNLILFIIILLLGAIYTCYRSIKIRMRIKKSWLELKANFKEYKKRKGSVLAGMLCNGLSSLTSIFAIYASARAIGVDITFSDALVTYTIGNVAANLIPTPGGIGAVEAGVYAGLVLVGVDGSDATLITLLYRLITYWLPILPGYYFFWGLRKDLLANYNFRKRPAL
jgi:glycosyltransferase 2 family protein